MQNLATATTIFDKLVGSRVLTPDGKDWLTSALDPFHDLDHQIAGYPDADTSSTVVGCYQYALDFGKDAAQTSTTWDAHIFFNPVCTAAGTASTYYASAISTDGSYITRDITDGGKSLTFGLVNVLKNNNGASLYPTSPADISATVSIDNLNVGQQVFAGNSRVIGAGLEIIDTTADIYKQGALVVYKLNQRRYDGTNTILYRDEIIGNGKFQVAGEVRLQAPPSTVAQALLLPGSRQWDAKKGCYTVLTQSSVDNPISYPKSCFVTYANQTMTSATSVFAMTAAGTAFSATVAPDITYGTNYRQVLLPYNTGGVMLTGLNANSTFRVKVKLYVESAPQYSQAGLAVLCTPSAPYDATALEAYSKALSELPVGVQAQYNALGDWFATIADILSKVALPISAALAPVLPAAPAIGALVSNVASRFRATGQKQSDLLGSDMSDPALQKKYTPRVVAKKKNKKKVVRL